MTLTTDNLITIFSVLLSAIATIVTVLASNNKAQAVTNERIDNLTEKVNKHNNVIERTYKLEERMSVVEERIKLEKGDK